MKVTRWILKAGILIVICLVLVFSIPSFIYILGYHPGWKRSLNDGEQGFELGWVRSSAVPTDWNSTFKVVCFVPEEIVTDIFPDFPTKNQAVRDSLTIFRKESQGVVTYAVDIDIEKFSVKRKKGMFPVSLSNTTTVSEPCIKCSMKLANGGIEFKVPEFKGHEMIYISRRVVESSILEKLETKGTTKGIR
jgi:hypothetical protein